MTDLFSWQESYPHTPGHRGVDTSIEAADKIQPISKTIQDKFYSLLLIAQDGLTTEELCRLAKVSDRAGQPRTAELRKLGKIFDSGLRRKSASGVNTIVWKKT